MSRARLKVWLQASRPKTLTAGISPVLVAIGLAVYKGVFAPIPATMCLLIALIFQISSNFINDYLDFRKGADTPDRIGPKRSVAEGLISPRAMIVASAVAIGVACMLGLYLAFTVNLWLIAVGALIAMFAYAYSGGPYPMSYHGLGDVCVVVFYGIIPVVFTYYVQSLEFTLDALILGLAVGFVSTNILVSNNYRDYDEDRKNGKNTTIVLFGKRFGERFYLINGVLGSLLTLYFVITEPQTVAILPVLVWLPLLHIRAWLKMKQAQTPDQHIALLGNTALNLLIFSLMILIGFII